MYLMMNNHEVQSQRIACPPAEVLESTCQLFSLPFRYERRSGIFAVHPPLLGKNILVESVKPARPADSPLQSQFRAELRILERLLWVSGAEVVLRESVYPEDPSKQKRSPEYASHWDLVLLVFPGQSMSNRVDPLAIYPWWQWACASYRLAGHLATCDNPAATAFTRASSIRMTRDLKSWFAEVLRGIDAPTVLLSVPLVDGYIDQFVESLSLTICQGVLRYFKKPTLATVVRENLRRGSAESQPRVRTPIPIREVPAEPTPPSPSASAIVPITPMFNPPVSEPLATSISPVITPAVTTIAKEYAEPEPPAKPEPPEEPPKDSASPMELAQADLMKRRDSITLMAQQTAARRPRMQRGNVAQTAQASAQPQQTATSSAGQLPQQPVQRPAQQPIQQPIQQPVQQPIQQLIQQPAQQSAQQAGPQPAQPPAPYPGQQLGKQPARQYGQQAASPHGVSARQAPAGEAPQGAARSSPGMTNLPKSQRDDEQLEKMRQLLIESPEAAAKQAAEILSSKGIRPTPEKIEEYMQYLNRMLLQQDGPRGNTSG